MWGFGILYHHQRELKLETLEIKHLGEGTLHVYITIISTQVIPVVRGWC